MARLSVQVQNRIRQRDVDFAWIEAAIAAPDRRGVARDPAVSHAFKAIAGFGGRVLRVMHRADGNDIPGITAHFDRRARR